MTYETEPYEPCPCGSGKKYKFCCAANVKRQGKFPMGTLAHYGPDDKTVTKIAAGVLAGPGAEPVIERWVATNILEDPKIAEQIKRYFAKHGVRTIVAADRIMGCPHEEGIDYPSGTDCPFCPFWAGKQGSTRRDYEESAESTAATDADATDSTNSDDLDHTGDSEDPVIDEQLARVDAIVGAGTEFEDAIPLLCDDLQAQLTLPCEVTGVRYFEWEYPYLYGELSKAKYIERRKSRPVHRDHFQLLEVSLDLDSEWALAPEDIRARVRRISDGQEFVLGLSELTAIEEQSRNFQLLDDYAVWFQNNV